MDKFDTNKPNISLIPSSLMLLTAEVLDFGAKKYSAHQWREGTDWSRIYSAMQRHMLAWNEGEDKDIESGISHLGHAACCLAFLIEYQEKHIGVDDRHTE